MPAAAVLLLWTPCGRFKASIGRIFKCPNQEKKAKKSSALDCSGHFVLGPVAESTTHLPQQDAIVATSTEQNTIVRRKGNLPWGKAAYELNKAVVMELEEKKFCCGSVS